jgi:hypothetical protein
MEAMKTIHRRFLSEFKIPCYLQPSNLSMQAIQGGAMNPRTTLPIKAPLSSLAAAQDQTPYSEFTHDVQELCSRAMDQAIGMEVASLDAILHVQSCVMEACSVSNYSEYQAASCFTPAFGTFFDLMTQTFTSFMELQMACLTIMTPYAVPKSETVLHVVAPARRTAILASTDSANLRTMPHPPAHGLEHSMDIAIGAHAA